MKFESLELRNFRNFEEIALTLSPTVNVFLGKNGQGKTNLLESLYFITHGSSFRPGGAEAFIRHESAAHAAPSFIRGKVRRKHLESQIELRFEDGLKKIFVDRKKTGQTLLAKNFPTVLFSPESLSAVKDGPEARRALVDEFLLNHSPQNRQILARYQRALRTRNQLFRSYKAGQLPLPEVKKIRDSLNPSFFQAGAELAQARIQALQALLPHMRQSMRFILQDQTAGLGIDYVISEQPALEWGLSQIYDSLQKRAVALEAAELSRGSSLVGPHKHDIRILFNGNDSRYYCSQGQQRALILSFKMAQIVYHYGVYQNYPVLLLDDVMSELDFEKRSRLVEFLSGIQAQILITTTDFDFSDKFAADKIQVFQIESGKIRPSGSI